VADHTVIAFEATKNIASAAVLLRAGELVGFPTETVYGLGADACNDAAVAKVFAAKGRPSDHPLIVHVASAAQVAHFAGELPACAKRLIDAFWPGPLSLILPRRTGVASAATGGQASVGLRCPSHPVAQALLTAAHAAGVAGVAAPSANRFGRVSPTTAAHVREELGEALFILDGGSCEVGIESTIIDCTRGQPVLLRPGMLAIEALEQACGERVWLPQEAPSAQAAPKASGTLESHYAPNATLRLMDASALQTALDLLGADAKNIALYARTLLRTRSSAVVTRRMPDDAAATAQQLFAALRGFDAQGVKLIWVETPPLDTAWDGVRDRLQRAAR
jgi:L-threonylcarbamoyladenylate synthase